MDIIKAYSFRSFVIIMFFMAFMCLLVNSTFYIISNAEVVLSGHKNLIDLVVMLQEKFRLYYVPMSAGIFGLIGILLWVCIRFVFVNLLKISDKEIIHKKDDIKVKVSLDNKEKKYNDRRLFLHLFSVFQREGRLMDFFFEDLNLYEDSQIGAAVRSIHENCKKVVDRAISPESVIDEKEGDQITIQQDFDPGAIKLIGNVTGEPPFKGIVRHRGWKAKRLEMPTLSSSHEPDIIAPAEIEIV
ncbi:MAG: DUF2760 domain-containing protein [Deltaproteobacteria bacterium]|nr:DUF2760 domain-containing protein [Deltaproteobacteria bacterium]